jgi:hypothetical protein
VHSTAFRRLAARPRSSSFPLITSAPG